MKVECGIVAPGSRDLSEPVVVLLGPSSLADAFPRIDPATMNERLERFRAQQQELDPEAMTPGERIDWKLSELKRAVRAARRGEPSAATR